MSRNRLLFALSLVIAVVGGPSAAGSSTAAKYDVRLVSLSPPRLSVTAIVPIAGDSLEMSTSRPGDVPGLDKEGWPALVRNLTVGDEHGQSIALTNAGAKGWRLASPHTGRLRVRYQVDYALLAERDWPAQREAAFADDGHLVVVGRSLFITTAATTVSHVSFHLPKGWVAITPWKRQSATDPDDLRENLIAFSQTAPDVVDAQGFHVAVLSLGHWQSARSEVRRVLRGVIPELVRLMGFHEREHYVVVLLPLVERGGESFRRSFAMTTDVPPSRANSADWGNTIAHEVFHYWNGWRLRGADYAATQWFQEGFTEYAANISMLASGLIDEKGFRQKLAKHVENYSRLKTTLEAPGTHKGPPLYSGGALVAYLWDGMIRRATGGRRTIADFYRELWKETDAGRLPYDWPRIASALNAVAAEDWDGFHHRYIEGSERLPLESVLP
jgi:predicted metalloprotease with PDZ domain